MLTAIRQMANQIGKILSKCWYLPNQAILAAVFPQRISSQSFIFCAKDSPQNPQWRIGIVSFQVKGMRLCAL